jgi:hypothetical protein
VFYLLSNDMLHLYPPTNEFLEGERLGSTHLKARWTRTVRGDAACRSSDRCNPRVSTVCEIVVIGRPHQPRLKHSELGFDPITGKESRVGWSLGPLGTR